MNTKNTHRQFASVCAAFVVLFVYVSRIFNKYFNLVALRIYKVFIFVFISPLLSFQQLSVFSMSQYLKNRKSPLFNGLLCLLIIQ